MKTGKKFVDSRANANVFFSKIKCPFTSKREIFFFNNVNSVESIYDFLVAQQSYNIKKMEFGFTFSADYKSYVSEYHKKHKHSHKSTNKR